MIWKGHEIYDGEIPLPGEEQNAAGIELLHVYE